MQDAKPGILLVDDQPMNLALQAGMLKDLPATIVKAGSGAEALERTTDGEYALIVLDVDMPEMDGFDAARRIRELPTGRHVPIIFLTGLTDQRNLVERGYLVGAVDYLFKPIDAVVFRSKVSVFLDLHRMTVQVREQAELIRRKEAAEHARELTHQRELLQAQKMHAVGRLATGVAHHVNNLLQIILGHSTMLLEERPPGDPVRDSLQSIAKAGRRGAELVRRLQLFTRGSPMVPRPVDLNSSILDVERLVGRALHEGVRLQVDLDPRAGLVLVDGGELEQALVVLVMNACEAMPDGGSLIVRTFADSQSVPGTCPPETVQAGSCSALIVSDTGHGMDDSVRAHLFEPFFTTKGPSRVGLGLSIVHGIAARNGGWVEVTSRLAEGSTFALHLPRCCAASSPSEAAEDAALDPALRGRSETILVVEPEAEVRRVLQGALAGNGYRVLAARNEEEALQRLDEEGPCDLLLCDLVLHSGSGLDLTKQIEARCPGARILYTTAHSDDELARIFRVSPLPSCLRKPFAVAELLSSIAGALHPAGH